jgi:hypothetical protein
MLLEGTLLEKLRKIEALHAGTTGEQRSALDFEQRREQPECLKRDGVTGACGIHEATSGVGHTARAPASGGSW